MSGTATTAADGPVVTSRTMIFYGIASALSGDIVDWYPSRDEAEATLTDILRDEPDFEGELWVEALEIEQRPN